MGRVTSNSGGSVMNMAALSMNPIEFEIQNGQGLTFKVHPFKSVPRIFEDLTGSNNIGILSAWFGHHKKKRCLYIARLIHRLMRYPSLELINGGRYTGRESVQGYLSLLTNPLNVHRPIFGQIKRWTLSVKKEVTMNTSIRAKSAQKPQPKTALFSVFYHRQLIASGLPGSVALRLKAFYPACKVKFIGMGA